MTKDKARKWDGKSRISNNVYRQRWDEIFNTNSVKPKKSKVNLKKNKNPYTAGEGI